MLEELALVRSGGKREIWSYNVKLTGEIYRLSRSWSQRKNTWKMQIEVSSEYHNQHMILSLHEVSQRSLVPHDSTSPSSDADVINIPTYSRWFSWNNIHDCEVRHLPEFFDGRSASRNPKVYKYYRNTIIKRFRVNPTKKITLTEVRKTIVGDVGSIRRVFEFLETWGLINYAGSIIQKPQLKYDDKESKANAAAAGAGDGSGGIAPEPVQPKKRICGGCKTVCSIACFACDKYDITLCARCYVRGNHRVGINSSDFKRVEISEELTTDWSDKEILQLLEAVMHYGDNWKKVAEHVTGKNEKECIARFVKLPFGEQFVGAPESAELFNGSEPQDQLPPVKRKRLSPLADASNPIMAQAAFLSALAGVEVAEVAARAALIALADLNSGKIKETLQKIPSGTKPQEPDTTSNDNGINELEAAIAEARLQLQKEEEALEGAISAIVVQTKEIEDRIVHFEDLELETERRRRQLQQFQSLLSVDQLKLVMQKTAPIKVNGSLDDNVKTE
ncbi:chromatin/chromatin-binding, or -regulatory protein [Lithospermum erythrorhizon]|uniref:Chromatin/chromatin-binding, or -regulatory protein n=1 Tax=Lithospermum erythrorhizon TaxID=34254 RepID=A0AAV3Q2U9_LITER